MDVLGAKKNLTQETTSDADFSFEDLDTAMKEKMDHGNLKQKNLNIKHLNKFKLTLDCNEDMDTAMKEKVAPGKILEVPMHHEIGINLRQEINELKHLNSPNTHMGKSAVKSKQRKTGSSNKTLVASSTTDTTTSAVNRLTSTKKLKIEKKINTLMDAIKKVKEVRHHHCEKNQTTFFLITLIFLLLYFSTSTLN